MIDHLGPAPSSDPRTLPPLDLAQWLERLGAGVDPRSKPGNAREPERAKITQSQSGSARSSERHRIRRAAAYLATVPPAISGDHGHHRTFHAACVLVKGFDLSVDEARPLLEEWNTRCVPPWSPHELEHKLRSADQAADREPRGYLLVGRTVHADSQGMATLGAGLLIPPQPSTEGLPSSDPSSGLAATFSPSTGRRHGYNALAPVTRGEGPRSGGEGCSASRSLNACPRMTPPIPATEGLLPDNDRTPHALASRYLAQRHTQENGEIGLRYWRDEFHVWNGSAYRTIPAGELRADLSLFLAAEFAEIHRQECRAAAFPQPQPEGRAARPPKLPKPIPVTRPLVADVIQALTSLVLLPAERYPNQPAWIDEDEQNTAPWPLREILPARNLLVHLPSFVASRDYPLANHGEAHDQEDPVWHTRPTPRFFHASALDFDFDASAPPPLAWLDFLGRVWGGDTGSIACLQEWFGYLLHGDTRQQKILMMVGPKRSGRGTIARVLKALAGSRNVVNPTLTTLSRPFGLASLIGKPIAVFPDARLSGRPDNAAIVECLLSISGEDDQTIDRKHLPAWTGRLPTRFVLISNELPKLRDASGALSSRLIILRFTNSFYGNEDTGLIDRLLAELPGILMWSIQGWDRLRRRGRLLQPRSAMELVDTMNDLASPIAAFLRDRCILEPSATIPVAELYRSWREWCGSRGKEITGDEHSFGRDLHAAIPSLTKTRPRTETGGRILLYKGVRLRSLADPEEDQEWTL